VSRRTIYAELTELASFVADQPCENVADDPQAPIRPGCGDCWVCRARVLVDRVERQARRPAKGAKPKPRARRRRRR
jgi:hypothetical protein